MTSSLEKVFKALAHDWRLHILKELVEICPQGVTSGQLYGNLAIKHNLAIHHLNILIDAGIINAQRIGEREQIFSISHIPIKQAISYLYDAGIWDGIVRKK